jgi:predicted nuclease with TOPRIM domain
MADQNSYLKDKQSQVNQWICQIARLEALSRETTDDIRIKFDIQFAELHQNLKEFQQMFLEFEGLGEESRNKFRNLVEKNWNELEESFERSLSEYEHLCKVQTEG